MDAKTAQDLEYGLDTAKKELLKIEEHLKTYPCPICLGKHTASLETHLEEVLPMAQDDTQQAIMGLLTQAREMRKRLEEIAVPTPHEHEDEAELSQAPLITYDAAIDEAQRRIRDEVTEDKEWSLVQVSTILTEVAEKHKMDADTLTRRTLTEEEVGFSSFDSTGRMTIEGKQMGPVLNVEEAKNRAAYARCVVDVFRKQPQNCITGLKEGGFRLRGHRVVDEQGKPVENCYNPYAVCRASVFGEYAQEDRITALIAEALEKAEEA